MVEKYCCFFGTGKSAFYIKTDMHLQIEIEYLIRSGVKKFIFYKHDVFNNLCHNMISALQRDYTNLKRIAFFEKNINYDYEKFYSAEQLFKNGKNKKPYEIVIDMSDVCIFNLDINNKTLSKFSDENSESALAYKYAVQMDKEIICIF